MSEDPDCARRLLELVPDVPTAVWSYVSSQRLGQLFALLLVAIALFLVAENLPALL